MSENRHSCAGQAAGGRRGAGRRLRAATTRREPAVSAERRAGRLAPWLLWALRHVVFSRVRLTAPSFSFLRKAVPGICRNAGVTTVAAPGFCANAAMNGGCWLGSSGVTAFWTGGKAFGGDDRHTIACCWRRTPRHERAAGLGIIIATGRLPYHFYPSVLPFRSLFYYGGAGRGTAGVTPAGSGMRCWCIHHAWRRFLLPRNVRAAAIAAP